ncbi:hypothetical protein OPIT5_15725 [Opitutaceae bacterium TAV5]|nr:hypothetical protein OPIT5_15725 [Opitutaceae bacterium TAV5]
MSNPATGGMRPADGIRRDIYYWKCDRPAAFHGTGQDEARRQVHLASVEAHLAEILRRRFGATPPDLRPGGGQGNHLMFRATVAGRDCMIRVEDGPEQDDYMEVEAHVIGLVAKAGVPGWRFLGVDSSRREAPFAWQIVERVPGADLNALMKAGTLDLPAVAEKIGACVARWQAVRPDGFGPFQPGVLRAEGRLAGFHATAADYFHTRLDRHLAFLVDREFISRVEADTIAAEVTKCVPLLRLADSEGGCLVHKDLALWNIIGDASGAIAAVIDWDDAIAGDPMDDLSLLACFYDGPVIARALAGYVSVRPLPERHAERFWLHLLRNMLWKSVIRVGAGYFGIKATDNFFLTAGAGRTNGAGGGGAALKDFTLARIRAALRGLQHSTHPETL